MNDQNAQMDYLVGIDTGGTFTDIVLTKAATGHIQATEVSSTPENPAIALVEGIHVILSRTKVDEEELAAICHGTTEATNALLQGQMIRAIAS